MLGIGQSAGIGELGVLQSQALGFAVHELHEYILGSRHGLGQRNAGIIAGLDDHALQQGFNGDWFFRIDEHARSAGAPGALGHRHDLVQRDFLVAQCPEHDVGGHELGQRSRFDPLIWCLAGEYLARARVHEQPGLGGHLWRRWQIHCTGSRCGKQQGVKQAKNKSKAGTYGH